MRRRCSLPTIITTTEFDTNLVLCKPDVVDIETATHPLDDDRVGAVRIESGTIRQLHQAGTGGRLGMHANGVQHCVRVVVAVTVAGRRWANDPNWGWILQAKERSYENH